MCLRKISSRSPFSDLFKVFQIPDAIVPYDLYTQVPPPHLIHLAKRMRKYRPGDKTKPVLEYACKIEVPNKGFTTEENPAPVILAAIEMIIGQDALVEALGEIYQMPEDWATTLAGWRGLLAVPVRKDDLGVLLDDLSACGEWGLANTIEQYCQKRGILPR